jgi:hypothetical protein
MTSFLQQQQDNALALLADMYNRWFLRTNIEWKREVYEQIRDILRRFKSQQDAYTYLVEHTPETVALDIYAHAIEAIRQIMASGGTIDTLVVGETDGYRHLCLSCSQDEHNFERVRFFQQQDRRFLLAPEVDDKQRSVYDKCQCCLQPIHPNRLVLFAFAGTQKHTACQCGACNRAGVASVVCVYGCDWHTQQVVLPALEQVIAPSKQRCIEQATTLCWEKGWYMLNKGQQPRA